MPRGYKDAGVIVAEVKMTRTSSKSAVLVVEGVDDVRFWTPRKHAECGIVDGEGKPNVVQGIGRMDSQGVRGVLGIVDEDYDLLEGRSLGSENLIAVCPHDLECLLCQSSALDKVLAEYGSGSKIADFQERECVDVRTALLRRAEVFGRLRWAAVRFSLDVECKGIRVPRFVDTGTWSVDEVGLMRMAERGVGGDLRRYIGQLPSASPWRVVRGHDVLEILRIGLKKVLGSLENNVGVKQLGRVLRAGIDVGELQGTSLWGDMVAWQRNNEAYRVVGAMRRGGMGVS